MKKLMATLIPTGLVTSVSVADIHIENGWAHVTVEGMRMDGTSMKIQDNEAKQDFLVGGNSPVIERVEVYTHINNNGVMCMREVKGGVSLVTKGITELESGSYRVTFMGLRKQLKEDERVPITLRFKNAKPQAVGPEVKTAPETEMQHNHGVHDGTRQH